MFILPDNKLRIPFLQLINEFFIPQVVTYWDVCVKSLNVRVCLRVLSHVCRIQLFATLGTAAHQAPLSMGILQLNPHLLTPARQGVLCHESHLCFVLCWVAPSGLTLCDPVDCSSPGSSVHGILQARVLEWVPIPFSRGSSPTRDQTHLSCTAGKFFTICVTREVPSEGLF